MKAHFFVQNGRYMDSVSLMQIGRSVRENTLADDVALIMGTNANKKLMEQIAPLSAEALAAKPSDLIILIKGEEDAIAIAYAELERLLNTGVAVQANKGRQAPNTLRNALRLNPDANLVLISLAADYAVEQAWQALRQKRHVFLFSDNVSLEDELRLKTYACQEGLLMMGPGVGTAIINQVGLGFSNAVLKGNIGIVSASGTGLQEVSSILAKQGVGISQAIGVGSRDLSEYIAGMMTFQAIEALKADSQTELIVLISKVPSPNVAQHVLAALENSGKPSVVIFMTPTLLPSSEKVYSAASLEEAALAAVSILKGQARDDFQASLLTRQKQLKEMAISLKTRLNTKQIYIRGLFSGGTLCEEAMRLWQAHLGEIWSNVPFQEEWQLANAHQSMGHSAIDLGDEEFTVGRPHPMIDLELRVKRIVAEAHDEQVGIIQLDVVIGYGAHENPAKDLAAAIREAKNIAKEGQRELIVIACLVGTSEDLQDFALQKQQLEAAGAIVLNSNAEASLVSAFILGDSHDIPTV